MSVDVSGAADRLRTISVDGYAPGRNRPGSCLRWCYFAYGITPNKTPASIAMDAWTYAPAEHRHPITASTVVPKGLPIILGPSPSRTDANKNAGDVFMSLGVGAGTANTGVMTDGPNSGTGIIGSGTLHQRAYQSSRLVLGYLTHWLGYDIASGATPAPESHPQEGIDMSFSLVPAVGTGVFAVSQITGNRVGVASPYHLTLLQRFKANMGTDTMLVAELDIVQSYLDVINPPAAKVELPTFTDAQIAEIGAKITPISSLNLTLTGKATL